MINYLAGLGWNDGTDQDIYTVDEIVEKFRLDRVVKAPSMFDMAKLKWVNGQHIRLRSAEALKPLLAPILSAGLLNGKEPTDTFATLAVANTQDKVELMEDAVPIIRTVLSYPLAETLAGEGAKEIVEDEFGGLVAALVAAYDSGEMPLVTDPEFGEKWGAFVKGLGKTLKRKGERNPSLDQDSVSKH